jgi:Spy/CpxP family protein refolding chaperone
MNKFVLSAVVAVSLLVQSLVAFAAEKDPFNGKLLPVELVMSFRKEIDLTSEQNKAIGKMIVEVQKSIAERQWQMQSSYFELMEQLDEVKVDEEAALALAKQAVDTENEIKLEQMRLLIRLRNLLEPQQIAFLREQLINGWQK